MDERRGCPSVHSVARTRKATFTKFWTSFAVPWPLSLSFYGAYAISNSRPSSSPSLNPSAAYGGAGPPHQQSAQPAQSLAVTSLVAPGVPGGASLCPPARFFFQALPGFFLAKPKRNGVRGRRFCLHPFRRNRPKAHSLRLHGSRRNRPKTHNANPFSIVKARKLFPPQFNVIGPRRTKPCFSQKPRGLSG